MRHNLRHRVLSAFFAFSKPGSKFAHGNESHFRQKPVTALRAISVNSFLASLTLAACAVHAIAQTAIQIDSPDTAIGESPFAQYDVSGIDNVNPINGNLYLNIPLVSFPQLGHTLRLQYRIYLNDKRWMINYLPPTYTESGTPVYGKGVWFLKNATAAYIARDQYVQTGSTEQSASTTLDTNIGSTSASTTFTSLYAETPDGSYHYIADDAAQSCSSWGGGESGCTSRYTTGYNTYPATDGTGYILGPTGINSNNGTFSILDRDGITYAGFIGQYTGQGSLTSTDANGNTITANQNGWTDSIGRFIPGNTSGVGAPGIDSPAADRLYPADLIPGVETAVTSTPCPSGSDKARVWTIPLPSGISGSYYLCYQATTYSSGFVAQFNSLFAAAGYNLSDADPASTEALIAIVLPNGTAYSFTYDSYLSLTSLTLPTGGQITYTWQNLPFWVTPNIGDYNTGGADAFLSAPVSRALHSRTVYPATGGSPETWTYNWFFALNSSNVPDYGQVSYSIVTDPMGNDTEHVVGGADLNGMIPGTLVETAVNYYQGCSPHNTLCSAQPYLRPAPIGPARPSARSILLESQQYALTPLASGGAQKGSNSYDAIVNPAWKRTTTQTTIFTAGPSPLVSKQVSTLAPAYGSCNISSLGPVVLANEGSNPAPQGTSISPCYQLDQIASTTTYDFGFGTPGSPIKTDTTNYIWDYNGITNPYATANLLDLPYSVITSNMQGKSVNEFEETDFGYDEAPFSAPGQHGNLTSTTELNLQGASSTQHGYYSQQGVLTAAEDANGNLTKITALQCGNSLPQTITDALGHESQYAFDCNTGLLTQYQNSNDLVNGRTGELFSYDSVRNPILIQHPDGGTVALNYNGYATPLTVTRTVSASPDPSIVSSIQYDGFLKQVITTLPDGATSEITYDLLGRKLTVANPHFITPSSTDGITTYQYDAIGRLVLTLMPDGYSTWKCFNGLSVYGQPNCQALQGSVAGTWEDDSDEAGDDWQKVSDNLGRLEQMTEPGGRMTGYTYDPLGNLLSSTQVGIANESPVTHSFQYDSLSRLLNACNPEGLPSGQSCDGSHWSMNYQYDANGNVVSKTDSNNKTTSYRYDALNRLTSKTYSDGTQAAQFGYDGLDPNGQSLGGEGIQTLNPIGRLTMSSSADTGTALSYDLMGRVAIQYSLLPDLVAYDDWANLPSSYGYNATQTAATYDLAGKLSTLTYPDGRVVSHTYDSAGRLQTVSDANQTYFTASQYFADGSPRQFTLGNGVQQTDSKNSRLQMTGISATAPFAGENQQQPVLSRNYCYVNCPSGGKANNGNIWGIADGMSPGRTQSFTYDGLNRIQSFLTGTGYAEQYTIDSFGNMSPTVNGTPVRTFSAQNRIANLPCASAVSNGAAYDAAGNQLCSTDQNGLVVQYGWDAENRMMQVAAINSLGSPFAQYTYGAEGARVRKDTADGNWLEYVSFMGNIISEKDASYQWNDYIYANGQKIARLRGEDDFYMTWATQGSTLLQWSLAMPTNAGSTSNYTVKTGDQLCFREGLTPGAFAGPVVSFSDNVTSDSTWVASDGQPLGAYPGTGAPWADRCADLTHGGETVGASLVSLGVQGQGPNYWVAAYADMDIVSADGTVTTVNLAATLSSGPNTSTDFSANGYPWTSNDGTAEQIQSTHYFLSDHLGSASVELAEGGWPVWSATYAPYGEEIQGSQPIDPTTANASTSNYKFTGKERDAESGLDYFGARYYSSNMGRWMSPDWADKPEAVPYSSLGNPQSLNLYGYVLNNPLGMADADGHWPSCDWCHRVAQSVGNTLTGAAQSVGRGIGGFLRDSADGARILSSQLNIDPSNPNYPLAMAANFLSNVAGLPEFGGAASVEGSVAGAVETESAPAMTTLLSPSSLSPEEISAGLQGAPYQTQQLGINADTVNSYIDKINAGETLQPIKMDGNIIVDGNHRAAASVLTGTTPPTTPGTAPVGPPVRPLDQVNVSVWPKKDP